MLTKVKQKEFSIQLMQCPTLIVLILAWIQHGQAVNSSVRLVVRLISYENPANLLMSGAGCDSSRSSCDPSFDLAAIWNGPEIRATSPCLSNTHRVYFPEQRWQPPELAEPLRSRDATMPSWVQIRLTIRDCLFDERIDLIGDFELNVTSSTRAALAAETNHSISSNRSSEGSTDGELMVLPSWSDSSRASLLDMKPIKNTPQSIKMKISVWIECSPGYYGKDCNIRCKPQADCCCDSEGRLRCDGSIDCSAQLTSAKRREATTPEGGLNNGGKSDDRSKDEATSVMFTAVMASSMTSILILAIIALVAIKMCKASESSALIISRLVSQDATISIDGDSTSGMHLRRRQNPYQLQQHQNLGYFNPALYNTLASQGTNLSTIVSMAAPVNNRTDSGVYEDPQEPSTLDQQNGDPQPPPPPPPPPRPAQPLAQRQQDEVQRMPQSKSYSRKTSTAARE